MLRFRFLKPDWSKPGHVTPFFAKVTNVPEFDEINSQLSTAGAPLTA